MLLSKTSNAVGASRVVALYGPWTALLVSAAVASAACGGGGRSSRAAPNAATESAPPPAARAPEPNEPAGPPPADVVLVPQRAGRIAPVSAPGATSSGPVALARLDGRTLAFIADADDDAIVTYDVEARAVLASTPIGARPSSVLVTKQGLVAALGADDARVHLMAVTDPASPLARERDVAVPEEPTSASIASGGDALLVASRWGHALSIVSLVTDDAPAIVDLPRDPAAVVASADGRRAIVVHAVGSRYSVVDLESRAARTVSLDRTVTREVFNEMMMIPRPKPVPQLDLDEDGGAKKHMTPESLPPPILTRNVVLRADQAFALVRAGDGRVMAPEVFAETGPLAPSGGYGGSGAASTISPAVAMFAADTGDLEAPGGDRVFGSHCVLPRGATLADDDRRLLVACVGSNEIVDLDVNAKSFHLHDSLRVPKGPEGLAFDPATGEAIVWSAFDRAASVVAFAKGANGLKLVATTPIPRAGAAPPDAVLRGRALFHAAFDARVSSDGRACASCHPDGRDDGFTWSAPGGARQTPILFARLDGTAPFGWQGDAPDLRHHLSHTTSRLGGSGLSKRDVADIGAYLAWLAPPRASAEPSDDARKLVARGREIFHSEDAECGSCHAGDALTDGDVHDVGSRRLGDSARAFDTPSLHFVARSAPYFHDGRYASLSDLVESVDGTMGHTGQLSRDDRAALVAYLRTL